MQKTIKRIALLLALTLAVTCAALFTVACGNTETEYSVQVVCDDNVDFTQLSAKWCTANAAGGEERCFTNVYLSSDGKATCDVDLNNIQAEYGFHVGIEGLDAIGYKIIDGQNLIVKAPGTLTIKIVKAN